MEQYKLSDPESWSWGRADIFSESFLDENEVVPKLVAALETGASAWMLGVDFCRSPSHPDGCYAVTLIKFLKNKDWAESEKIILERLNESLQQKSMTRLIWSSLLLTHSRTLLRQFQKKKSLEISSLKGFRLYYAYRTDEIGSVPTDLIDRLIDPAERLEHAGRGQIREIAISVGKPKSQKYSDSGYWVALVGN